MPFLAVSTVFESTGTRASGAASLLMFVVLLAATASVEASITVERSAELRDLHRVASRLPKDATLRLTDVVVADSSRAAGVTLEVTPMQVVAGDAKLVLDGGAPQPLRISRVYLTGSVVGEPRSRVTLAVGERGAVRGLVRGIGGLRVLQASNDGRLAIGSVEDDGRAGQFACGNEASLTPPPLPRDRMQRTVLNEVPAGGFTARVALETDHEYFALFGNVDDASAYAADLVAFSSTIYQAEADTSLGLVSLSLWTDSSDPWEQTGASCRLSEFGGYWNQHNTDVDRTLAHFLSGTNLGGGIAWVGVLCQGAFDTGASCPGMPANGSYGGDYGVTGNLRGTFDIANPSAVWDIVATAHEIGHNFNSPHTHCYAGIGGNPDDVDQCYGAQAGCFSGAPSLPGPMGQASGTLMSYCHARPGGLSNIALTLGLDHAYGNEPQRVPDRMLGHVIQRESAYPGCLTTGLTAPDTLFADEFESADSL